MHTETLEFAISNPNSHIAIVDVERYETIAHFGVAQFQLSVFTKKISRLEQKIYLANGTVIFFIPATSFEKLRGLQLDRIEAAGFALFAIPENFLQTRLKPDVTPNDGIILRERGEYGGNEPILGFAQELNHTEKADVRKEVATDFLTWLGEEYDIHLFPKIATVVQEYLESRKDGQQAYS